MPFVFHMLGKLEVTKDGALWSPSLQEKTLGMVAYMVAMKRPQSRQSLAELFCSEANDRAASLRWHLSRIRKAFGKESLLTEGPMVSIKHRAEGCDLFRFEALMRGEVEQLEDGDLSEALELYRGPFLQGMQLKNTPNFDIWLTGQRSRLGFLYEQGMQATIQRLLTRGAHQKAIAYAQKLVSVDPLREETHSLLMWLYARNGQREAAIQQYELCKSLRKEHLDVPLLDETEELYQQVLEGDFSPTYEDFLGQAAESQWPGEESAEESPFVGRTKELSALKAALRSTSQAAACVLLEAEAGGGKTRLVDAFLSHTRPRTLIGRCYASEQALPFQPWIALFEGLLDALNEAQRAELPAFVHEQLSRLAPQLATGLDPVEATDAEAGAIESTQDLQHLYAALKVLLSEASGHLGTLVCWIDDLHWADEASLHLLHFLLHALEDAPLLWLLSLRPEELHENPLLRSTWRDIQGLPHCKHLVLSRLSREDIGELLEAHSLGLPEQRLSALGDALYQQTGGHPFYATEVLTSWAEAPPEDGAFEVVISSSIQSLLARRFERWTQAQRQILETLAVFGRPASLRQIAIAGSWGEEEIAVALERGLAWWVLEEVKGTEGRRVGGSRYRFAQAIVQQALMEQLSPIRRERLHHRVALALEQTGETAGVLAHHWRLAGEPEKEQQATYLAAVEAMSCFAYDEATAQLRRSIELAAESAEALPLQRMLGDVLQRAGHWDDAAAAFQSAFALARRLKAHEEVALCALSMGRFASVRGDLTKALQWCKRAKDGFVKLDLEEEAARAWGELGKIHRRLGAMEEAIACYRQKIALAEANFDNQLRAEALGALSGIYMQLGQMDEALACFEQTLQIATEEEALLMEADDIALSAQDEGHVTISRMMGHAGFLSHRQDQYMEALSYVEQQLDFFDESGQSERVRKGLKQLGTWYALIGDFPRAFAFVQRLFDLATRQFSFPGLSKSAGNMGDIYVASGALESARKCYEFKLSVAMDLKEKRGVATALCRLAAVLSALGQGEVAKEAEEIGASMCRRFGFLYDLLALYEALAEQGARSDEGQAYREAANELSQTLQKRGRHSEIQPATATDPGVASEHHELPEPPIQIQQFHIPLDRQLAKARQLFGK